MMLIALKESVPEAQAVGYQHVAFTPRHLNLMFSEKELNPGLQLMETKLYGLIIPSCLVIP